MAPRSLLLVVAMIAGGVSGCGVEHLPPPQAPSREAPQARDLPTSAPPPGTGRLVVDANGEQAEVAIVSPTQDPSVVAVTPLCTTPCVVDLPYGPHPLLFHSTTDPSRESETEVDIGPRPKVLRHSLGERREGGPAHTTGTAMIVLGAIAATTGIILWSAAAAGPDEGRGAMAGVGQAISIGGAAAALLGIPLVLSDRPTERPGTTTEWPLPSHVDEPVERGQASATRK
ncbi:MAG: hypothetical protein JST00_28825 [Deltaproteobacteria bacterium]|nr:hypothetical protein [Deltaproteobacteria bacterium]